MEKRRATKNQASDFFAGLFKADDVLEQMSVVREHMYVYSCHLRTLKAIVLDIPTVNKLEVMDGSEKQLRKKQDIPFLLTF